MAGKTLRWSGTTLDLIRDFLIGVVAIPLLFLFGPIWLVISLVTILGEVVRDVVTERFHG